MLGRGRSVASRALARIRPRLCLLPEAQASRISVSPRLTGRVSVPRRENSGFFVGGTTPRPSWPTSPSPSAQPSSSPDAKTINHPDGRMVHTVSKIVPFPAAFMCELVADVASYKQFLPFCADSVVKPATERFVHDVHAHPHPIPSLANHPHSPKKLPGAARFFEADLSIGYSIFTMTYASLVTVQAPYRVLSESLPSRTSPFSHLVSQWEFSPVPEGGSTVSGSCRVDVTIDFHVSSSLYAGALKATFQDTAVRQLEAFVKRAATHIGPWQRRQAQAQAQQQSVAKTLADNAAALAITAQSGAAHASAPAVNVPWGVGMWQRRVSFSDDHMASLVHAAIVGTSTSSPGKALSVGDILSAPLPTLTLSPTQRDVSAAAAAAATSGANATKVLSGLWLDESDVMSLARTLLGAPYSSDLSTSSLTPEPPILRRFRERAPLCAALGSPAAARALWEWVRTATPFPSKGEGSKGGDGVAVRVDDAIAALHAVTRAPAMDRIMCVYHTLACRHPVASSPSNASHAGSFAFASLGDRRVHAPASAVAAAAAAMVALSVETARHVVPRLVLRRALTSARAADTLASADASSFLLGSQTSGKISAVGGNGSTKAWVSAAAPNNSAPGAVEAITTMERIIRDAATAAEALPAQIAAALPTAPAPAGVTGSERWVEFGVGDWSNAWLQRDVFEVSEALAVPGLEALADWAVDKAREGKTR